MLIKPPEPKGKLVMVPRVTPYGVKIGAPGPPLPVEPGCAGRCRAGLARGRLPRGLGAGTAVWDAVAAVVR